MKYVTLFIGIILLCILGFVIYTVQTPKTKATVVADLQQETLQQALKVEGKIPEWLSGSYVRNGPVSFKVNGVEIPHWFDGLAMLHAFSFDKGQVNYSNKFLRTDPYKEVFDRGNLYFGGFSTPSKKPVWERIVSFLTPHPGPYLQNANVNVAQFAKKTVALTETPLPVIFDLKTLDTLGAFDYPDDLPKKDIFESAHPQEDKHTKEMFNYLVHYGKESFYVVYRLNPDTGKREVISKIPVEKPAYMHSFALTQNYIILVEFPLVVNPIDLMLSSKGFIQNFNWKPELGTNFIIVNRKTGEYKTLKDKNAFFAFHHVNALEKDDNIVLDMVTYPDAKIITDVAMHGDIEPNAKSEQKLNETASQTKLMRYTLSLKELLVNSKAILEKSLEFPRVNEAYQAYPYQFAYLVNPVSALSSSDERPLYKINTETGETLQWSEPGVMPGEPVFIADPNGKAEDDGVVVTIVLDHFKQRAFLLMLDGKTFKEIARSYTPHQIPEGLHGAFFSYRSHPFLERPSLGNLALKF